VVIGFSERSSPAAIDGLASLLFEKTAVTDVIIVGDARAHDGDSSRHDLHPSGSRAVRRVSAAFHRPGASASPALAQGEACLREPSTLFEALKNVDLPLEPILCAAVAATCRTASNGRRLQLRRDEAGGRAVVCAQRGNAARARDRGFRIVPAVAFLTGEARFKDGEQAVITFEGSSWCAGRGLAV